jgi:Uncharacterised protein family (UPF0149)
MEQHILLSGPIDLDALDNYLLSDHAPDDSMGLSDLDGLLTGIVVGPELILPSELAAGDLGVGDRSSRLRLRCGSYSAQSWAVIMRSSAVSIPSLRTSSRFSWGDQKAR